MSLIYQAAKIVRRFGERTALQVENLRIEKGEALALTGPNGSGKSTLLHILAFLDEPSEGELFFYGDKDIPPRRQVTLLLQAPFLLKRSVFENIAYGLRARGDTKNLSKRVYEALHLVALDASQYAKRNWYELSGGEAQRVALASRMILNPKVLLLDEPTSSLDVSSAAHVQDTVTKASRKYGMTVIVSSHDHAWLKTLCNDELVLTSQGKNEAEGSSEFPWQFAY